MVYAAATSSAKFRYQPVSYRPASGRFAALSLVRQSRALPSCPGPAQAGWGILEGTLGMFWGYRVLRELHRRQGL